MVNPWLKNKGLCLDFVDVIVSFVNVTFGKYDLIVVVNLFIS